MLALLAAAYQAEALLAALAIKPEDHGPVGDLPHDEGWRGSMLGLRYGLGR